MKRILSLFAVSVLAIYSAAGQSWYAEISGDTLSIGNSLIDRTFCWKNGQLSTISITDKANDFIRFNKNSGNPDLELLPATVRSSEGHLEKEVVPQTEITPSYLKVTVSYRLNDLDVKRVFRIYEDTPAIACDTYLKGSLTGVENDGKSNHADRKNIESAADMKTKSKEMVLDQFNFDGQHWHVKAVEFMDVTDWNNNLVTERNAIAYRRDSYRGNLLMARNAVDGHGFYFLKEAPCSSVQLAYGGSDFIAQYGKFKVTGIGLSADDVSPDKWTKAYSCVVGVYGEGEMAALTSLRKYQKNTCRYMPERDEMVMMNTWGDRSQDTKVNEAFCLSELQRAARLGVSHFQIDDGWQYGKSPNSAVAKGSFKNIWDNPDYWTPDTVKYPRGLTPVVEKGRELGIEVCLWYNPSIQNDFEDWEKDVNAIVGLYRKYGIRVFKIDGLAIPTKKAEENLRKLFDTVLEQTDNAVVFNLDVTAGRRGGYHMFNEYGNIFLENRYTDWNNYFPYWTLRNIWTLSRYVPAEKIQVEFLNKWRNPQKYTGNNPRRPAHDPFAPSGYSFEYVFATSMAGQPLAWMEASNLPEEAFEIAPVIKAYREVSADFHSGVILPVGEEPSGRSWTGFQSVTSDNKGYMIIYRESNQQAAAQVKTWLPEGAKVKFEPVVGYGKSFRTTVKNNSEVMFSLPNENSYVLYKYRIL